MVKTLPTVERSTKIRFGKNCTEDQGENTIVLNASNTAIDTSNAGAIYITPVRFDDTYDLKEEIVLMMYNTETKELVESGVAARDIIGNVGFDSISNQGNTSSNVVRFVSNTTSFITQSNVGIANASPGHTLSVGSNLYVSDTGSHVLVISGGVLLDGNLTVNGGVTSITTENLKIKDAIIELGQNNTSSDTTLDLGLIMTRPNSNVTIGFLESSKEIVMGFTESSADSNVITPLTSEDINVHVYGRLYTEANVGVLNTNPMHTLDVGSNLYVDVFGSNILVVSGNTSISGDLTIDTGTLHATDQTDATSKTTGTVIISGGLGVTKNIHGKDIFVEDIVSNSVVILDTTTASSNAAGAVIVSGGLGVAKGIFGATVNATDQTDATSKTTGTVIVSGGLGVTKNIHGKDIFVEDIVSNSVVILDTTTASSNAAGAVIVSGGLGVAKGIFGATVNATDQTDATSKTTGTVIVSGGLGVTKNIHGKDIFVEDIVSNSVVILDTTTSTSATTGALKVAGGISTQENLNVAANVNVDGDTLVVNGSTDRVGINKAVPAYALDVVGDINFTGTFREDGTPFISTPWTIETSPDALSYTAGNVGIGAADPVANLHVTGNAYISSTTDSSSNIAGALIVSGGIGVAKGIYAATVNVTDQTDATSKTTGALQVLGGLGVTKNIHGKDIFVEDIVSNSVVILDTTTSTSSTTGALKVAGGISTQENLNVAANVNVDGDTLVVNCSTDRVGINKAVPAYALDVVGDINFSGTFREDGVPFAGSPWNVETSPAALNYTAGNVGIGAADPEANLHVTGNAYISSTTDSSSNIAGALIVSGGIGVAKGIYAATVNVTDQTDATSSTTGALKVAGGVGIAKDVYVGERAYVTGGLITNTGQVTKKTYSFTGALTSGQNIANSTIKITFSAHVFYAKIVAHLIESDNEVSTLSIECGGGHRSGGTPLVIAKGGTSVFGNTSTNPWNSTVAVTTTTVSLAPTTDMAAVGNYNVFIEYISAHASGAVTKITEGSTDQITFGY